MEKYKSIYKSPKGFSDIILIGEGEYLTGLFFEGSRDAFKHKESCEEKELPVFTETKKWLDGYFNGRKPDFTPRYKIEYLTPFRKEISEMILSIPYGETVTYGDIARAIAQKRGIKKMSAQAVGGAVGGNPICLIIPCHRVVGSKGDLVGYGGGIENKMALLRLEQNTK